MVSIDGAMKISETDGGSCSCAMFSWDSCWESIILLLLMYDNGKISFSDEFA